MTVRSLAGHRMGGGGRLIADAFKPCLGIGQGDQRAPANLRNSQSAFADFAIRGRAADAVTPAKLGQGFELFIHVNLVKLNGTNTRHVEHSDADRLGLNGEIRFYLNLIDAAYANVREWHDPWVFHRPSEA